VFAATALVEEIVSTLDFYRATPVTEGAEPTAPVSRVLLTGSGALLGGLDDLLGQRLDVPVERLDALARVRTPRRLRGLPDIVSSVAVPAGLCVGASR
jgi:Tfp pilus assembly PilM family ATPase